MDGLSGAASVIAVVSLAVQLADVVKSVYDFWKSVDEAPDFVHEIVADLKLLSTTLAEIAQHEQKHGNNGSITDILENCTGHIQTMLRMTSQLEFGIQSKSLRKRKWSAIKAVFKEEKIAKFQQRLLNVKTTLLLARQTLSDRSVQVYFDQNGRALAAIMETLREQNNQTSEILASFETNRFAPEEALEEQWEKAAAHITNPYIKSGFRKALDIAIKQTQKEIEQDTVAGRDAGADISVIPSLQLGSKRWRFLTSHYSSTTKTMFGDITIHTSTYRIESKKSNEYNPLDDATKTRIIFRPSTWVQRFGVAYELQFELFRSTRNWKTTLQIFQPVPDDSLIFQFCHSGNIQGVQTLFSRKEASVWDTNSRGWTPLHFAAHTSRLQLVRFLLSEGANPDATTHDQLSCFKIVWKSGFYTSNTQLGVDGLTIDDRARFDISPYFSYQYEWGASSHDGELSNCGLPDCPCESDDNYHTRSLTYSDEQFKHVFSKWRNLILSINMLEALSIMFLEVLADIDMPDSFIEWVMSTHKCLIDARWPADSYTPIIVCAAIGNWVPVQALAGKGANLHFIGIETDFSPREESATSISLYDSTSFFKWRDILRDLAIDITAFIETELRHDRLRQDGWTTETLSILFDLEFSPVPFENYCQACLWEPEREIIVETGWRDLLERIKKGDSLAGYIDKYSKFRDLDTDDQESYEDLEREIIEISSDENSENEETSDDESEIPEGEGYIEDEQDDAHEERSCTDESGSTMSGCESNDEKKWKPEWMCISCWHKKKDDAPPTTAYDVLVSEDDSSEDESPMLLNIDI